MGAKTRAISNFVTNATGAGFGMVFLAEYDGSGGSSHSIGPSIMTTDLPSIVNSISEDEGESVLSNRLKSSLKK